MQKGCADWASSSDVIESANAAQPLLAVCGEVMEKALTPDVLRGFNHQP
jgi:hypothetical protein